MIKIDRANTPPILQNTNLTQSSYSHPLVMQKLFEMQFGKCAYCEKSIEESRQVDHYIPLENYVIRVYSNGKKLYNWNKANKWENLIYSCQKCNRTKNQKNPFNGSIRVIIDPTNRYMNPEKYLDFRISSNKDYNIIVSIIPKGNSPLGKNTIDKLKLDIRKDHIGKLNGLALKFDFLFNSLILRIKQGQSIFHGDIQTIVTKIQGYMLSNIQHAGFARSYFSQRLHDFNKNEKPKIERELRIAINLNITIPEGVVI